MRGWFTCAGCQKAFRIVQVCGIEVELTTNGQVQPVETPERGGRAPRASTSAKTTPMPVAKRTAAVR